VITGMVSGGVQSGSLKGALIGGFSAGMFKGIGAGFDSIAKGEVGALGGGGALNATGIAAKIGAHAVAGGVMSVLQGGKFGHGFISAGVVEAIGPKAMAIAGKNDAAQIVAAAVVGGTASRLAGGKFANGAVTGAFQWAFNHLASDAESLWRSSNGSTAGASSGVDLPEKIFTDGGGEGEFQSGGFEGFSYQNPTGLGVRGCDQQGCGGFDATRVLYGQNISHGGTDYTAIPGQNVFAVSSGVVRIGNVYRNDPAFKLVQILRADGAIVKQMYISPSVVNGQIVSMGQAIGTAQRLPYANITQHIHVDIIINRVKVNPESFIGIQ
jgi:hypothetical protein